MQRNYVNEIYLAVDLDQSIGAMLPKLPVIVHHTWHSFMISSWVLTYNKK